MSDGGDLDILGGGFDGGDGGGSFTETTFESWGSRMKQSCTGIAIGALLFFGSFGLLVWNEGRAVNRQKDLDEGSKQVQSYGFAGGVNATVVDSEKAGTLIHIIAPITANETLSDPILGIEVDDTLKFRRFVEMYQWKENSRTTTKKTSKGGKRKETTYSYEKLWSTSLINSNSFKRAGHENPNSFPIDSLELEASTILLGPFSLADRVVSQINWYSDYSVTVNISDITDATLRGKAEIRSGKLYFAASSSNGSGTTTTAIGDTRVDFDVVDSDTVSIVAKQAPDGELDSFTTSRGGDLLLFQRGSYSAAEMFAQAEADNNALTWGLRFVGFFVMFAGICFILQPFATFVDVIPFIGGCMSGGMEKCLIPAIAFIICIPLSLFTIALAWIVYRPIVAGVLLGVTALVVGFFVKRSCDKKNAVNKMDSNDDIESPVQVATEPPEPTAPVETPMAETDIVVGESYTPSTAPYVPQPYVSDVPQPYVSGN